MHEVIDREIERKERERKVSAEGRKEGRKEENEGRRRRRT
jgi:hypothetical protein